MLAHTLTLLKGAGGTGVIILIVDALGRGWTFTLIGLLILASSFMPWMLLKWGPKWREERWLRIDRQRKGKEQKDRRRQSDRTLNEDVERGSTGEKSFEAETGNRIDSVDGTLRESGSKISRNASRKSHDPEKGIGK